MKETRKILGAMPQSWAIIVLLIGAPPPKLAQKSLAVRLGSTGRPWIKLTPQKSGNLWGSRKISNDLVWTFSGGKLENPVVPHHFPNNFRPFLGGLPCYTPFSDKPEQHGPVQKMGWHTPVFCFCSREHDETSPEVTEVVKGSAFQPVTWHIHGWHILNDNIPLPMVILLVLALISRGNPSSWVLWVTW